MLSRQRKPRDRHCNPHTQTLLVPMIYTYFVPIRKEPSRLQRQVCSAFDVACCFGHLHLQISNSK
ncbi:predicted protein [Plenodomus lingam JN3]|uniref:Predicted protein n=1 Tax=Leptosphaeria maculans (strain JN3 / isolate v23.1.3 / race Av1-4-5-6-7-8) TaxID=985895 RepID=E4ZYT8_LEPMJ|nr:predicted protein [Plenodomus lingam JN3]CBX96614.1 predicted protein [Plenodomus lingam JN3]